jgi:tetratricopeptide (TPR) repeat protein
MGKVSRNDPCPCGSGKKYKRCCLPKDEFVEVKRARRRQVDAVFAKSSLPPRIIPDEVDEDDLTALSNQVVDLLEAERFDEARLACEKLKQRFPEEIDWLDRTAILHQEQGEFEEAIQYYRRCLEFIDENPEGFEKGSRDFYRRTIERLESKRRR